MNHSMELVLSIVKKSIIILAILIIISFIFLDEPMRWAYGYIFGGLIGVLNFLLLARTMERAVKMPPHKAQGYASVNYFIRFVITGVVLIVAFKADYINALAAIVGIVLIKLIILVTNLFDDKEYYRRIFSRKGEN
ncbi:MAG: ATP synthase subunit I [Bacillota bacterium]|nr:ATP synthase subunit I [Bacillota bacterium]